MATLPRRPSTSRTTEESCPPIGMKSTMATTPLAGELLEGVHPLEAIGEQLDRLASGQVEGKVLFDPTLKG